VDKKENKMYLKGEKGTGLSGNNQTERNGSKRMRIPVETKRRMTGREMQRSQFGGTRYTWQK
jgi:hypothetical protein